MTVILIVRELLRGTLPRRRVKNILGLGCAGDAAHGFDDTSQYRRLSLPIVSIRTENMTGTRTADIRLRNLFYSILFYGGRA